MKIEEIEELEKSVQKLKMNLSHDMFYRAYRDIDDIHSICESISVSLKSAENRWFDFRAFDKKGEEK